MNVDPVEDWWHHAACLEHDPELFFPEGRGAESLVAYALSICGRCPVRAACLDDALSMESAADRGRYGIRGGVTAEKRGNLVRAYQRPKGAA